jgi:hypothetical protein
LFQVFSPNIFFFSSRRKEKKHKGKKTVEKKIYAKKGRSLPLGSHFALSLLAPASTLLLLHISFKKKIPNIFFFSNMRKEKKHKEKKTHREKKKCKKRRELTFKLLLCILILGSRFCPPTFAFPFQALSLAIFFFSSRRREKKH